MVTPLEEQKVRSELLEWGRHHTAPVQLRSMAIALNLARLEGEPDNLKLRRETTKRIASLEEALRIENAESAPAYWSGNDKPPEQQHEPEHRPTQMGRIASPVLAFVFGFLFIFIGGVQV